MKNNTAETEFTMYSFLTHPCYNDSSFLKLINRNILCASIIYDHMDL